MRAEILRAATRAFAERGFDGTSLQDIADAVGLRKASLLYHFASKEQLRLGVLEELLERWNAVLPRFLMAAAGRGPRFGGVMQELVEFFAADPNRARLLLREILDRPDDMRERLETHVAPWVKVVADSIREGQKAGDIHVTVDPEAYVLQVINMVVSGVATAASLAGALITEAPAPHAKAPRGNGRRKPSVAVRGQATPAERTTHELLRIARESLFRERASSRSESR